jgi:hypothetical protein
LDENPITETRAAAGKAKPFYMSKWEAGEAYKRVKANQGAAGVDEQSIADFERDLKKEPVQDLESDVVGQLLPPPVRTVPVVDGRAATSTQTDARRDLSRGCCQRRPERTT